MDTVTILRDLWRARRVVLFVWFVALLAGMRGALQDLAGRRQLETRKYEVGVATTSILIDTPSSQVVEIAPEGFRHLGRAREPDREPDGRRRP